MGVFRCWSWIPNTETLSCTPPPHILFPSSQQEHDFVAGISLLRDYLRLAMAHPVPMRMVKGHVHKLITPWLAEHHDLRDKVNCGGLSLQVQGLGT